MDETSMREAAIFSAARRLPVEERAAYLDGACAGNALLRRQIEELLEADESAGAFLAELATGAGGPIRAEAAPDPGATLRVSLPPSEQPGDTIDRYKLMEQIGEGGCGVVYVADQTKPVRRRVALKVIKLGMDTQQVVARFEAERQALAMMDHPNIAKVLDAGTTQTGRPYFVMELVRGIRITDYCDQASLTTKARLDLFIQVCQAIQHAHQKGIIHRDIKPSNILVTLHDGVPVPKVIDFGIAKATEGRLTDATVYTQLHQFIGTPAYMSPEQAEMSGLDIDTRSDIYSLGVLLYELLVGSMPFDAQELMSKGVDAMRKIIREKEPPRPSTRVATLGADELTTTAKRRSADTSKLMHQLRGDLDWIVMKCLEKDRSRRYETANGLAADLKRHLNREPVVARPPSSLYRFQKMVQRNKLAFAAAGAVAAALVLGLGVSTSLFIRESKAHDRAVAAEREQSRSREAAEKAQEKEAQERRRAEAGEQSAQRSVCDADMLLAFQALDAGNLGRARELMRKHLPQSGETDLRGWEWRYLWRQCRGDDLFTLDAQTNGWSTVATFFPDGRTVAAASMTDKTVKLFDLESRRLIATLPHSDGVAALAVSPDGKLLASGCDDGTIRLWDAAARQVMVHLTNAQAVSAVAFSVDGKVLAWSDDEHAVMWDVAARRERASYARHLRARGFKSGIALSPDSRLFAFGRQDGKIEVWDWQHQSQETLLEGHQYRILTLAFSPDGKKLVSGDQGGIAKVWEMSRGRTLATLTNHSAWVGSLSFSPDGKTLATASADQTVKLWSTESWEEITTLRSHEFEVWWVAYSPDGRRLITASRDGTLRVWDAHAGGQRRVAHLPVSWPHWSSPNGQFLLRGHTNGTFSVTDTSTLQETERRPWPITADWPGAALSNDKRFVAVGFPDGSFKLLDAATGHDLANFSERSAPARRLDFSPDGSTLAVIKGVGEYFEGRDQVIEVWDLATRRQLRTLDAHANQISRASFSPDGHKLALGYLDGIVEWWDLTTGGKRNLVDPTCARILGLAYSKDGRTLATAGWGPHIELWEVETGKELAKIGGALMGFASPAFSDDGRRLAVGADDGTVALWDMTDSKPQQVAKLKAGEDMPLYVSFPPGGDTLVARDNYDFYVWRAPSLAEIDAVDKARGQSP
jgi:WD40 repeat protein/serine/threonine protein kinase